MILKSYLPAAGLSGLRKITQGFMQAYLQSVEKVSSFDTADDAKKIVRGCCIFAITAGWHSFVVVGRVLKI